MGLAWVAYLRGKDGVAGQVLGGCYATLESLGLRPNPVEREWVGEWWQTAERGSEMTNGQPRGPGAVKCPWTK